jgi:hypothetical protein
MERITMAYAEWTEFVDRMEGIQLKDCPPVDWHQLGQPSFAVGSFAKAILRTIMYDQTDNRLRVRAGSAFIDTPILQVDTQFDKCIKTMLRVDIIQRHGLHIMEEYITNDPYLIAYQALSLMRLSLEELQTIARNNYVSRVTENKREMALAVRMIRGWGFNTFAVRSRLNDDVLAKIKSFV